MPLPNITNLCGARAKSTGQPCKNAKAFGQNRCRMHGSHRNVVSGQDHHWFIHGHKAKAGEAKRKEVRRCLALYEEIGHALGFITGKKTPGRKPS